MSGNDNMLPLVVNRESTNNKKRLTKQRAIYSETLGRSTKVARQNATSGPQWANKDLARNPAKIQQAPSVRSFRRDKLGATAPEGLYSGSKRSDADDRPASGGRRLAPIAGRVKKSSSVNTVDKPGRIVKPTVIIPYEQAPGKLPRRLQIERKTRQYASQNIDELLRAAGVDYSKYPVTKDHETGENSFLALEIFDDRAFEVRAPKDWIMEGTDSSGRCSIEGRGLRVDKVTQLGKFEPCQVVGYDRDVQKFLVRWEENPTENP